MGKCDKYYMKKKSAVLLITVFLVTISLFFSSCSSKAENQSSSPKNYVNLPEESSGDKVQSPKLPQQEQSQLKKQKVVESSEEYEAADLPLIAAVPDKNIYLYGIKPNGIVLYVEGKGHYFKWDYMTPRFILPQMNVGDYDNDGEDELSVVLYVGSGTGYSVEDLHIIELSEKEIVSDDPQNKNYFIPNPEYFKDNLYRPDDYISQINKLVKLETHSKDGELTGKVMVGNQSYEISLKKLQSTNEKVNVTGVYFGDIVKFKAEANNLKVQMAMGIITTSFAAPFYVGEVHADVIYKAGRFTMSNLRFVPEKD